MSPRRLVVAGGVLLAAAAGMLIVREAGQTDYAATIEAWRHERLARLASDEGWLTLAGLFWLQEGANGAGPDEAIALPPGSAPGRVGVFELHGGRTSFRPAEGAAVALGGRPVTGAVELRPDLPGPPDVLTLGDLSMFVIKRGERWAIRLRDRNGRARREFTGLTYFPIRKEYRIVAAFTPYAPPRTIDVPNVLGETEPMPSPGFLTFTLHGKTLRLDPVIEVPGDRELFVIFRDDTSGVETYPSGRFLYTPMPEGGKVVIDFNKAYNPPCAFTPYATCPLPPPQNRLSVRVEAGEKTYGHH